MMCRLAVRLNVRNKCSKVYINDRCVLLTGKMLWLGYFKQENNRFSLAMVMKVHMLWVCARAHRCARYMCDKVFQREID